MATSHARAASAAAFFVPAITAPVAAAVRGDRGEILQQQKQREAPRAAGRSADGGLVEILVSPRGGWTILITYPKRPTWVVALGRAWLRLLGRPE